MNHQEIAAKPISLSEFKKRRRPLRNLNMEFKQKLSRMHKLAIWITQRVGTIGFFIIIFIWTVLWLGWNVIAPKELQFDPSMGLFFGYLSQTYYKFF